MIPQRHLALLLGFRVCWLFFAIDKNQKLSTQQGTHRIENKTLSLGKGGWEPLLSLHTMFNKPHERCGVACEGNQGPVHSLG